MYEDDDWDQLIGGTGDEEAEFNDRMENIDPEIAYSINDNFTKLFDKPNPLMPDKAITKTAKKLEKQIDKDIVDNLIDVLPPVCNCKSIKLESTPCPVHDLNISICPVCECQIDPDYCWCGEDREGHGYMDGHSFIPMGCKCGFVKGG